MFQSIYFQFFLFFFIIEKKSESKKKMKGECFRNT